jgi:predicted RNA-binding protein
MADETPNYWVLVGSKSNYDISRQLGFTLQGIKSNRRKQAELVKPGDKFLFYLTGLMRLGGIISVLSHCVEDFSPIWDCSRDKKPEVFPYRFKTEPYLVPESDEGLIPVAPIHEQLQYLKKWPEKNWTLGFQGHIHQWPETDYRLVEDLFRQQLNK